MLSCANNELVLTNIPYARSGTYTVVVTNVFGAVTSAPVTLNVIAPVARRRVPGVNLTAQAGNFLGLDYRDDSWPCRQLGDDGHDDPFQCFAILFRVSHHCRRSGSIAPGKRERPPLFRRWTCTWFRRSR